MKKLLLIIVMILCVTSGCTKKEENKTDAIKFKEEYESLNGKKNDLQNEAYSTITIPEDNAIKYSNIEEILSLIDGKTGIIYFGNPECSQSRNAASVLLNTANMVGIETIYYFNAEEIRDIKHLNENGEIITDKEGTDEYYALLQALDEVLPSYKELNDETMKRLYFPTVVFIKEGKIIGMHEGTVDSQADSNQILTENEEKELSQIYSTYMHDILGDVCDKSC